MISDALRKIIVHAYTTTKLYKDLAEKTNIDIAMIDSYEDFYKLPIITKNMMQQNPEAVISNAYQRFPLNEHLTIQRTSGSTGQYMRTYWHVDDMKRSLSELWILRMKRFNVKPTDKHCYFYTTEYIANKIVEEKDESINPIGHSIGFCKNNITKERWETICRKISDFQPKWMMLQPSTALLLGESFQANGISIPESLKYIEVTGEYLFDQTRKELKEIFRCDIANQYGCNEANSIAFDCNEQSLHIMNSNVYVEILSNGKPVEDGEIGDIHITSLTNFAMPFVRYAIGDRGRWLRNGCKCGYRNNTLELVTGRMNEYAVTKNREKILPYIFVRPIEHINERVGNIIRQFQVTQENEDRFVVKLVIKSSYKGWKESIEGMYLQYLKEPRLKDAKWDFVFLEELLPLPDKNKFAYFISFVHSSQN